VKLARIGWAVLALATPLAALAHEGGSASATTGLEPWITLPLALAATLYAAGLIKLWRKAGAGHGVERWRAVCFAAGVATLAADIFSPLHALAGEYFVAHMSEHELLMAVAAPLLALSRPLGTMLWGLPAPLRATAAGAGRALAPTWRVLERPAVATLLHGAAIWLWHIPALFDRAALHPALHEAQHLSFLGSGLLFWAALFRERRSARHGVAAFWLFITSIHTGLLGAALVFSQRLWYTAARPEAFTALEDQQLAGLVMWIPASVVYGAVALMLCYRWISPGSARWKDGHATA
jgi:putative membrane protein